MGLARTKLKNLLPSRRGRVSVMGAAGPARFKQRQSARMLTMAEVEHRGDGGKKNSNRNKKSGRRKVAAAAGRGAAAAEQQIGTSGSGGPKSHGGAKGNGATANSAAANTDKDGQTCEQLLSTISILASRYVALATVLGDDNEDLKLLMEAQQEAHEVRLHTQSVLVSVWKTKA